MSSVSAPPPQIFPIHTVKGGACIGSSVDYFCALEKKTCPERYNYVSPRLLLQNHRDSPAFECLTGADKNNAVPVGRCTQDSIDYGICTGHESNCEGCLLDETAKIMPITDYSCFQPTSDLCELRPQSLKNDRSINFASFGLCVDESETNNSKNNGRCLWSREECLAANIWRTPTSMMLGEGSANIDDFCTCDKVHVGACVKDSRFICAVSPDACDSEQEYIGANQLLENNIDCRLCKEFSISKHTTLNIGKMAEEHLQTSMSITQHISLYYPAGACINESEYWCALESSQCVEGYKFVSARKLDLNYRDTPAIRCLNQTEAAPLGQCTQEIDKGICTGHMSNCQGCLETADICFQQNIDSCELQPSQDNTVDFGIFGVCLSQERPDTAGTCLWSQSECPQNDIWVTPNTLLENSNTLDDICTCDKVQIGACMYGDGLVCAVSEDACDEHGQYIRAKDLVEYNPTIDCRLCNSFNYIKDNETSTVTQPNNTAEEPSSASTTEKAEKVTKYSVAAGACVKGTEYWCALEKTQCAEGYNFVPARILNLRYRDNAAISCINKANAVPMGQCTKRSDEGICTGHMSNCEGCYETEDACFEMNVLSCALRQSTPNINHSSFGLCVDEPELPASSEGHCLWSRDECPVTSTWITPSRRLKETTREKNNTMVHDICTCENVLIGACRFGNDYICAVSKDSCDITSEYIGAKQLRDLEPSIDCRLCRNITITEDDKLYDGDIEQTTSIFSSSDLSLASIIIISILFASAVAALVLSLRMPAKKQKRKRASRRPDTALIGSGVARISRKRPSANRSAAMDGLIIDTDVRAIKEDDSALSVSSVFLSTGSSDCSNPSDEIDSGRMRHASFYSTSLENSVDSSSSSEGRRFA